MFRTVCPVLPAVDMKASLEFWQRLGFQLVFCDSDNLDRATYCGVRKSELTLHLQSFTQEQRKAAETIAIRIEMRSEEDLERLHEEWEPLEIISAPLGVRPWGTREFGFYSPEGCALFFFAGQ